MITKDELKIMVANLLEDEELTKCEAYIDAMDLDTIYADTNARFVLSIWDKKSNVNAATADVVLASYPTLNVDGAEAYMIEADGRVQVIQPNDYEKDGLVSMTKERALELGAIMVATMCTDIIFNSILENYNK